MSPNIDAKIVADNIKYIREYAGLTFVGFAEAVKISISYLRLIEKGTANITYKVAKKISDFCEIEPDSIFSAKALKLKKLSQIATINIFYTENINNPQYFISRKGENSIAHFLKNVLLPSGYLIDYREVNAIQAFCKSEYNKDFTSKELSRELNRLADDKKLLRFDKYGNKSIYLYKCND
ncbi:helix-turn-helix transcriptional regulator [Mucilaginibacter sp. PAMB04274]|uniref:helix-turn-helix domain-containing protein n=1 Tax=Mucilaginibacter sp. PAMB04274 TaxID=3138568 RepID=UPI0031F68A33